MPALFLELFSEEIPARMQSRGAADLARLVSEALAPLNPGNARSFHGPRRIALALTVNPSVASKTTLERGPRANAPGQALAGFLRKHDATEAQLRREGDYWVLEKISAAEPAEALIAQTLPPLLRRFPWPKSMRWGDSAFVWVRPLRRIICLLDGAVVPFTLADDADTAHGLASDNLTEGHRFHAPGPFAVSGVDDWIAQLRARHVLVDAPERRQAIATAITAAAAGKGLTVVDDPELLDEVTGLVEFPVIHLGRIADEHMDLPPEVMRLSMKLNQRYFALREPGGTAAPWFAFAANIAADDGGGAIIAGNERVLRARFADARHFWDLDRKARLESLLPRLDHVTYHAKLGSQGARVTRLKRLAGIIAPLVGAGPALAERAAELAKADLLSGMVGEFPELQGVMGRYYALHDNDDPLVADAIRDHYAPRGQHDAAPDAPVSIAVALADKIDQLAGFFAIGERPTGSGDPYALRRAALGIIRIIRENTRRTPRFNLIPLIEAAGAAYRDVTPVPAREIMDFLADRLRVALRAEGSRHDVLAAVFAAGGDDDIARLLAKTDAVAGLLNTTEGADLLAAYRRAANILRIEDRKDGPHGGAPDRALLIESEEIALNQALDDMDDIATLLAAEDYTRAMARMSRLRAPLDAFFERCTVNAESPQIRRNRLYLLHRVRSTLDAVADLSRIEL
jgi:glycyl-tRNA synthetase beta chain